jgi:hypothetical protein
MTETLWRFRRTSYSGDRTPSDNKTNIQLSIFLLRLFEALQSLAPMTTAANSRDG